MAHKASTHDLREFMDDDERQYFDAPERTENERNELLARLQSEWQSIPDPQLDDLKPPYMHANDWAAYESGSKDVIPFHRRRWKKQRRTKIVPEAQPQQEEPQKPEAPRSAGVPTTGPTPTPEQRLYSQLLTFMSEQGTRVIYDEADPEQKQILLEAARRAFEAAENRRQQKLRHEQELMEKILDTVQQLKEDPAKADLLPRPNLSRQELLDWYAEISKPKRPFPFPGSIDAGAGARQSSQPDYGNPTPSQIRQDRIWRARQSGQTPDPDDIAEEEAEAERYQRKLAQARERKLKELEAEFAQPEKGTPGARQDPKPVHPHGDPRSVGSSRDPDSFAAKPGPPAIIARDQVTITQEPAQESESKLVAFIDSNLTWGSFGVIVAGLATLVSSSILLAFGWVMLTVSLYRHFFKGRSWPWQVFGTLFIALLLGIALLVIWLKFRPT